MCHSGNVSQIIKPMEREWHLNSRFLLLFLFLIFFFPSRAYSSSCYLTAARLHSVENQALMLVSPCSTRLPHPISRYLIYGLGFFLLSLCSHLYLYFVPIDAAVWTGELEHRTDPADKISEKSPSFRAIISLVWITAFLSKNLCQDQVKISKKRQDLSNQHRC